MFPRGPRFEPFKVPDVPGPNTYNPQQDSVLDSYKRGAFLEKTDRFAKDKQPPMPVANPKSGPQKASPTQTIAERYAILQKKVEDLEKVHLDGKKSHHVELERLKQDLALSQKLVSDNADKYEKQKKQNTVLESRIQDLKKNATSDQSELKDLRHKVRLLELERDKVSSKQPEVADLRKSLQALETKRKDDLKDRDRRIADLEKLLQAEKKKRESLEQRNHDSKRVLDEEAQTIRSAIHEMEARLQSAQAESRHAKETLRQVQDNNATEEADLLEQLQQHRRLLTFAAQQYGTLVSQSVSSTTYRRLQHEHAALQCRQFRLERKLANSEGQAVELTHLIRQVKEDSLHLSQLVRDALEEISFFSKLEPPSENHPLDDYRLRTVLDDIGHALHEESAQLANIDATTNTLTSTYYRLKSNELFFASSVLAKEYADAQGLAEQRESDLSSALASHEVIAARLESIQKEMASGEDRLKQATNEADNLRATVAALEAQIVQAQQEAHDSASVHANALRKEKDTIQRLTSTIQKNRMAEEALRAEIDQLTTELTNAERFQEAYYSLSDEVGSLITRKQIAEDEADRISKFNAEILGHNNPAQRIMYVDRIRRELAEAKHKVALLTREQENVAAQNNDLQHELHMYTSVRVPLESKPRTNITRIGRPPLVNLTQSLNVSVPNNAGSCSKPVTFQPLQAISDADMTIDEIM